MAVTLRWGFDSTVTITSFEIEKSTDKGLNFSALITVTFDLNGVDFDRDTELFFYTDGPGNPGDIYRVRAVGGNGNSDYDHAISPASASVKCVIIGYIQDAFGNADTSIKVFVESYGTPGEKFIDNPSGLVAHHGQALGIVTGTGIVFPNDKGIWQVELVQETYARIRVPELDFDVAFQVPAEVGPKNIRDIRVLRGASFDGIFSENTGVRPNITSG